MPRHARPRSLRGMPSTLTFLVESYSPDPSAQVDRLIDAVARRAGAAEQPEPPVGYRGSIAVPGDELAFHLFDAVDTGSIITTCSAMGIRCDRIVPVVQSGLMARSVQAPLSSQGDPTDD